MAKFEKVGNDLYIDGDLILNGEENDTFETLLEKTKGYLYSSFSVVFDEDKKKENENLIFEIDTLLSNKKTIFIVLDEYEENDGYFSYDAAFSKESEAKKLVELITEKNPEYNGDVFEIKVDNITPEEYIKQYF